jgi:hypothetical protein
MNALANETNVKNSLKKYFVDLFDEAVTFDVSLAAPDLRKQGTGAIKQWYNVKFGQFGRNVLAEYLFDIYCLSRQDAEGKMLSITADAMMNVLLDSSKTDGMRRIPFYDVSKTPWELIGAMVVQEINDAAPFFIQEDETKVKIFNVRLRWGLAI